VHGRDVCQERIPKEADIFHGRPIKVMVKQSHDTPGRALRVSGGGGSQISRKSTHEGGEIVSRTHRPPYPPGNIPGTVIPRLTKIIRPGITFVSRNLR